MDSQEISQCTSLGCKAVLLSLLKEGVLTVRKARPDRRIYKHVLGGPEVPIHSLSGPSSSVVWSTIIVQSGALLPYRLPHLCGHAFGS